MLHDGCGQVDHRSHRRVPAADHHHALTDQALRLARGRRAIGQAPGCGRSPLTERRIPVRAGRIRLRPRPRGIDHRTRVQTGLPTIHRHHVNGERLLRPARAHQPIPTPTRHPHHPGTEPDPITKHIRERLQIPLKPLPARWVLVYRRRPAGCR